MNIELLALRVIHVGGAIVWVGTTIFVSVFLLPAMRMAGPAGAPVMAALVRSRLLMVTAVAMAIGR